VKSIASSISIKILESDIPDNFGLTTSLFVKSSTEGIKLFFMYASSTVSENICENLDNKDTGKRFSLNSLYKFLSSDDRSYDKDVTVISESYKPFKEKLPEDNNISAFLDVSNITPLY
jgi:hypothetical protein